MIRKQLRVEAYTMVTTRVTFTRTAALSWERI